MPSTFNYKFDNFIENPTAESKTIRIFNKTGKLKYEIVPDICYFYSKNNIVVISVEDEKDITLDFETQNDALRALTKLNQIKIFVSKNSTLDTYTRYELDNGALDIRYYTKSEVISITGLTNYYDKEYIDNLSGSTGDLSAYLTSAQTFSLFIPLSGSNEIAGNLSPLIDGGASLGEYGKQWKEIYVSGGTIWIDYKPIQVSGNDLKFSGETLATKSYVDSIVLSGGGFIPTLYYTKTEINNNFLSANTQYVANNDASSAYTLSLYNSATAHTDTKLLDYYTKIELQTTGQSQVHWNNISFNPFTAAEYTFQYGFNIILDQFPSGGTFNASWEYAARNNTNQGVKMAQVYACWDNNTGQIEHAEVSTRSIGNTTDFDSRYSIKSVNGEIQFRLDVGPTDNWTVKLIRRLL